MQLSLLRVSGQLLRQRARPDCTRLFSSTSTVFARRKKIEFDPVTSEEAEDILDDDYDNDDTTSGGHMQLRDQRQQLYYMRVIEHEMPKLVGAFERSVTMSLLILTYLFSPTETVHTSSSKPCSHCSLHRLWRRRTPCRQ